MTQPIDSLEALLAPMSPAEFLADYRGKKPLHIKGAADKFADVMSWEALTGLINQSSIWSSVSMHLVLDGKRIDPKDYCATAISRDKTNVLMPDLELVGRWLRRGASLILDDIDQLTPDMRTAAKVLEDAFGAKVQANLYCSWKAHPAFGSHFDNHDVFAVHVAGTKTWRIFQRHFRDPIPHASFRIPDKDFHERHKGKLSMEVTLNPGDLLYIPRGWYHDALAKSEATIHVAFGVTCPIGVDLFNLLFEHAVKDPLFRAIVPCPDGPSGQDDMANHLAQLGQKIAKMTREPAVIEQFAAFMRAYRYPRASLRLPDDALDRRFRRTAADVRLARNKGAWHLTDGRQGAPIPEGLRAPIAWVLDRRQFAEGELAEAFGDMSSSARAKLLADLEKMAVIAPA